LLKKIRTWLNSRGAFLDRQSWRTEDDISGSGTQEQRRSGTSRESHIRSVFYGVIRPRSPGIAKPRTYARSRTCVRRRAQMRHSGARGARGPVTATLLRSCILGNNARRERRSHTGSDHRSLDFSPFAKRLSRPVF